MLYKNKEIAVVQWKKKIAVLHKLNCHGLYYILKIVQKKFVVVAGKMPWSVH